jgi:hypothetical protein
MLSYLMLSKCIIFTEIVQGRDASVRVTEDGMIWAVDLIMVVSGKSRDDSSKILRDLREAVFHKGNISVKSMQGRGNGKTKLVTFQDAIELIMVLPGKVAKETRTRFASIIQRYMVGFHAQNPINKPQTLMPPQRYMTFVSVIQGRDASVRVTEDDLIWAVDLVMVGSGKSRDDASKTVRDLKEDIFPATKIITRSMPGKGNRNTKLLRFEDAIEFIMILPGKMSKFFRKKMADVISRYLDGDLSLINDIVENQKMGKVNSYQKFAQESLTYVEQQSTASFGYIYAFASPAFPGCIKIGRSIDVERRLAELNTGCAPAPLVVVATAPSFDNVRDEKIAHQYFSNFREAGEFFHLSEEEVKTYFNDTITAKFHEELEAKTTAMNGCIF